MSEEAKRKREQVRVGDDLEILSMILSENRPLKERIQRFIENSLGKTPDQIVESDTKRKQQSEA